MPDNAIVANLKQQAANNSYIVKAYYVDEPFTCKDCGSSEVWTAKQQQWWFEVAKGEINSGAVRCRACRQRVRDEKAAQKAHMDEMSKRKGT